MSLGLRVFQHSSLSTQCEECRLTYELGSMGGCTRCRRVLCNVHLHGSFFRRLLIDIGLGGPPVCVKCRASG